MVRGTITEVSRDKNGLPRKGGPVFSIEWDDGLREGEVTMQEMQSIVKTDEKILGGCTALSDDIPNFLKAAGALIGGSIDYIRKFNALEKLRTYTIDTDATVAGVYQLAMQFCVAHILQAQKVEIWEATYDKDNEHDNKKIFSVAKLDLKGELKRTRAIKYLRHLSEEKLRLFHDAMQNRTVHLDMDGRRRDTWNGGKGKDKIGNSFAQSSSERSLDEMLKRPDEKAVDYEHHTHIQKHFNLEHTHEFDLEYSHESAKRVPRPLHRSSTAPTALEKSFESENEMTALVELDLGLHAVPIPSFEMQDSAHVLVAPFFDVGFDVGVDSDEKVRVGAPQKKRYALVVSRKKTCTWTSDLDFVDALAMEMGKVIECVRYREKRR